MTLCPKSPIVAKTYPTKPFHAGAPVTQPQRILVTDFDGTMTREDFFRLVVTRLLGPDDLAPWEAFLAGRVSHFSALQQIFGKIRAPESALLALLDEMRPDPLMPDYAKALQADGWRIVIASAGCEWYIRIILKRLGVSGVTIHANPGLYHAGGPLEMRAPVDSPFYSPETGVDKAGIVRFHLENGALRQPAGRREQGRGPLVVYAGDGLTDVPAGLLVPPGQRFARADMAAALRDAGQEYRSFDAWSDVAEALLRR